MFVSVVIPTFNRRETLARTLECAFRQSAASGTYEVIVVDDCSADDTLAYLEGMASRVPNLVYIHNEKNKGRVVTRNEGIRAARGELVVLLDDDNVPGETFVEAHREFHSRWGETHVVVMGNVQYAPESIRGSNFGRYLQSRYIGGRSPKEKARLDYDDLPPRCLGAGNCSIRREDLLMVGLFDENFRHYGGEDEDLGYRLSLRGLRMIFGENARTLHWDEVTLRRYKEKLIETARLGLRVMVNKIPDYVEGTQVRFLLPVDWKKDSPRRLAAKLGIRAIANPLTTFFLERWARFSDRLGWAYLPLLYRFLTAAWVMRGYESTDTGSPMVAYGERR